MHHWSPRTSSFDQARGRYRVATSVDVANRPTYPAVHVAAVLGALIGVMGLVSMASSMRADAAWLLARAGVVSAVIGLAVFTVESTSEGLGLSVLAKEAASATGAHRADLVRATSGIAEGTYGPSLMGMAVLIGIPLVLVGSAMVMDTYPSWLGWAGICIGAATALVSLVLFLRPDALPGFLLYGVLGSLLAQAWLGACGVVMLRRVRTAGR